MTACHNVESGLEYTVRNDKIQNPNLHTWPREFYNHSQTQFQFLAAPNTPLSKLIFSLVSVQKSNTKKFLRKKPKYILGYLFKMQFAPLQIQRQEKSAQQYVLPLLAVVSNPGPQRPQLGAVSQENCHTLYSY